MGNESQIVNVLNDILVSFNKIFLYTHQVIVLMNEFCLQFNLQRVEAIEEAFSCIIVHNTNKEKEKIKKWQTDLTNAMMNLAPDQQENAVSKFLYTAAEITNYKRMHLIMSLMENLVSNNILPAR